MGVLDFFCGIGNFIVLPLFIFTSFYLSYKLKFIQIRYLPLALKRVFTKQDKNNNSQQNDKNVENVSNFKALMAILSGSTGTGNITGVATAIVAGGPGAIFWIWITAILGMVVKFTSCTLGHYYRNIEPDGSVVGGPMTTLTNALNMKKLAIIFSFFCTIGAICIGAMVQTNSLIDGIATVFPYINNYRLVSGFITMFFTAIVIIGGIKRIANIAAFLVPMMVFFYCGASFAIIIYHFKQLPHVFYLIINSALNVYSISGAMLGLAVKHGLSIAVISSEAGLGSAPIALANIKAKNSSEAGLIAMIGPIFDTLLLCTVSAVIIILSNYQGLNNPLNGTALVSFAFEAGLGAINPNITYLGKWIIGIGIFLFAYTTIITWAYYGDRGTQFIAENKSPEIWIMLFRIIYLAAMVMGAIMPLELVWKIASLSTLGMMFPNLISLLFLSNKTKEVWSKYKK